MFDRKVNDLEKRVKSATVENSVIKEEMCAQHQQIQGLMMQLESSRDMMQANQGLMEEIEELKAQLADKSKKGRGKFKFMSGKKKKINWL
jgi:predicted RNase H-like nuclease (RuvC/YqgF family)